MILPIVRYGHPALRQKGARVDHVDARIRQLVTDMFDTMYAAHGIGLAAQQVGEPLQITVLDVRGVKDRPSTLLVDGVEASADDFMPLVLINPELVPGGEPIPGPEGCLSFPEIFAEVSRPAEVSVTATAMDGRRLSFRCSGLLAKAVQHEVDHLNGILFIDRMNREEKLDIQASLESLMAETKEALEDPEAAKPRRERRRH